MSRPKRTPIRQPDFLRLVLFIVLEGAYLALAGSAYSGIPIPKIPVSDRKWAKLLFNVLFVLWHAIAAALAIEVLTGVFSSEWIYHLSNRGHLIPGKSDRVSILTATSYDHAVHLFERGASRSFRLGFFATILLFVISSLAPSALRVDIKDVEFPRTISVADVKIPKDDVAGQAVIRRAWEIVHSSQSEQAHFGFASQEGWLIPWPDATSADYGEGTWTYPSDVVQYRHVCQWATPSLNNDTGEWTAMGLTWISSLRVDDPTSISGIYPLVQHSSTDKNQSTSAFLFIGSNTTLTDTSKTELTLNLSSFPEAAFSPNGFTLNSSLLVEEESNSGDGTSLAMMLLCDPQMTILGAMVTQLANNTLQVKNPSSPYVGNFPSQAAQYIFSRGLQDVTSMQEPYIDTASWITFLAGRLFLDPNIHDNFSEDSPNTPRPLSEINSQMDVFVGLASKAFLGGYQYTSPWTAPSQNRLSISGTFATPGLALFTNDSILVATAILVSMTIILLALVVFWPQMHSPFTLETILIKQNALLSASRNASESLLPNVGREEDHMPMMPLSPNRLPHPSMTIPSRSLTGSLNSSQQEFAIAGPAIRKHHFHHFRLAVFFLLELGYIALAGFGLREDGLRVSELIHRHQRIAKGGFSIVFIFWQVLAIYFVQHVVAYIFSTEWHVRFQRTHHLLPHDTDRVSTLGRGYFERGKLFLTPSATWSFRTAFLLSLIFLAISSVASGTIFLDSKFFFDPAIINVGNLTFVGANGLGSSFEAQNVLPLQRSSLIAKLEFVQHEQFGYSMDDGYLFGWPRGLEGDRAVHRYGTDIVHLNFTCHWDPAPNIISGTDFRTAETSWSIYTSTYAFQTLFSATFNLTAGVHPLVNNWIPDNDPYFVNTSLSAFAVFGENGSNSSLIDLTGIPSASTLSLSSNSASPMVQIRYPSRMALLVCDPKHAVTGGTVQLNGTSKHISLLKDGQARTNNFPEASINVTLSHGFLDAISNIPEDSSHPYWLNNEAAQIFFLNNSADPPLRPLEVTAISSHIQSVVISASKAFLGGYTVDMGSIDPSGHISTTALNGESNAREEAVLVTNRTAYIASICLIAIAIVMLIFLVSLRKADHEFNLANVLDALAEQVTPPREYHHHSGSEWN